MSIIDDYLIAASEALRSNDPTLIDATAREIVSAYQNEIPNITSYRGGRVSSSTAGSMHTADDLRKLIGKLKVFRENKDAQLYGECGLGSVTDSIRQLEDALNNGISVSDLKSLYDRIDHIYSNVVKGYTHGLSGWSYSDARPGIEQTKLRIEKLRHYRDDQLRLLKISEKQNQTIEFNQAISNSATANAECHIELTAVLDSVDGIPCERLSEDDKTFLKGLLAELSQLSRNDKDRAEKKVGKFFAWMADKSVDVAIAAAPYVMQVIQSLG